MKDKVIIYGAGGRGIYALKKLRSNGISIEAFCDINAKSIKSIEGIKVYLLEELPKEYIEEDIPIVVAVTNVFLHEKIVQDIQKKGFNYIVYKSFSKNEHYSVNMIYNQIFSIFDLSVNLDELHKLDSFSDIRSDIRLEHNEYVEALVPIELLFGLSEDFYKKNTINYSENQVKKITDKSIFVYTVNKYLFEAFFGRYNKKALKDNYNDLIQARIEITGRDEKKENDRALLERYDIFRKMLQKYEQNPEFVHANPIEVEWNTKGYFNIQDGNNRAAFLVSMGHTKIPARIKADDFELWNNNSVNSSFKQCIDSVERIVYPIGHIDYQHKIADTYPWIYQKMIFLCEWMWMNVSFDKLVVLDYSCKNGFIGQLMARMGVVVYGVEEDEKQRELCLAQQKLLRQSYPVYGDIDDILCNKIDMVFVPEWKIKKIKSIIKIKSRYFAVDYLEENESFFLDMIGDCCNIIEKKTFIMQGKEVSTAVLQKR